ncbi:hypothetical protein AMECASPLE_021992 [Ameca splendens]|uniref:Uncharacterized protein n=1 Tax=Ameca splendens TaxID=208324 RepID=A0ABV0ZQC7_9TELE
MITGFFPLKKLRRNGKYFLFAAVLLVGALVVYHEMVAARAWSSDVGLNPDSSNWRRAMLNQKVRRDGWPDWVEDSTAWMSSFTPQTWKPEELPAYSCHMRLGIIMHQEEPRTHCTSEESNNWLKDFIQSLMGFSVPSFILYMSVHPSIVMPP